jgi:hypothetical protein
MMTRWMMWTKENLARICNFAFPPKVVADHIRSCGWIPTKYATCYATAVLEYLSAELMEIGMDDDGLRPLDPDPLREILQRHITDASIHGALARDTELAACFPCRVPLSDWEPHAINQLLTAMGTDMPLIQGAVIDWEAAAGVTRESLECCIERGEWPLHASLAVLTHVQGAIGGTSDPTFLLTQVQENLERYPMSVPITWFSFRRMSWSRRKDAIRLWKVANMS